MNILIDIFLLQTFSDLVVFVSTCEEEIAKTAYFIENTKNPRYLTVGFRLYHYVKSQFIS